MTMAAPIVPARRKPKGKVTLAHGGGGKAMRDLVEGVFVDAFGMGGAPLEDQARLVPPEALLSGGRLAMTTDGFVVDPLFFPGGDIGKLAVWGTVNDLAVGGAVPHWLSVSMIIEEGLDIEVLERVAHSMREAADLAGVRIVTGDTKVVARGGADKLFVTTAGVGVIPAGRDLGAHLVQPGDVAIVNGYLGRHGAAILAARGEMMLETAIESDCAPLNGLMEAVLSAAPGTRCARDATRGGLASLLNEVAAASGTGFAIEEARLPLEAEIRGFCEVLGFDPLYLANEGRLAVFVPPGEAEAALAAMRDHEHGREAAVIGQVTEGPAGRVVMNTAFGGSRIVDMLVGDQLPRIC
ncbi:hydrogenase expression/formation protein HypE [Jiella marina]|uniref:hydrogenase expression/formation protein HypE n=1 Tax=Jiella sp. LLJ827 TaxID=2917712 RepID=UPI002101470D|nr:hydrogenase expression/formation protein HypE [Jiella sp. LLJ827]MCQ0988223.1 hydrogenase expression/formation protein HypE [Jiella sp. LLJ827]